MPSASPRVAVVIPTFNRAHMITDALWSLVDQTESCEVFVLDDGSEDNTAFIVDQWQSAYPDRVRFSRIPHVGMTRAFNAAVAWALCESKAPYIAWLGSDDAYTLDAVQMRADVLAQTGAAVVQTDLVFVNESRWQQRRGKAHTIDIRRYGRDFSTFQGNVHTGTAMFRREAWIGWHDEIVTGGADLLWLYELFCRGAQFAYLPRVTYHVRRHPGRQLYQRRAMDQEIVKRELDEVYWPLVRQIGGDASRV